MKKIMSLLLSVLIISMAFSTVSAETYSIDDTGKLSFEDTIDIDFTTVKTNISDFDDYQKKVVAVLFKPETYELRDSIDNTNIADRIIGFGFATVDEEGEYSFNIQMKGATGTYKLLTSNPVFGEKVFAIYYESKYYIDFNSYLGLSDDIGMMDFVVSNDDDLTFDLLGYEYLGDAEKELIKTEIMSLQSADSDEELKEMISSLPVAETLIKTAEPSTIADYMKATRLKEGNKFNNEYVNYLFDDNFSADEINSIVSSISEPEVVMDDLFDTLAFEMIKVEMNKSTFSIQIEGILKNNIWKFASADVKKYSSLSNKSVVDGALIKGLETESTLDDYVKLFSKIMAGIKEEIPSKPVYSGGGGGGGGGAVVGINPSVTTPAVTNPSDSIVNTEDTKSEVDFKDISSVKWAEESINTLVANGIISGYSDTEFRPSNNITREEFVKLLTSGLRLTGAEATVAFNDVTESDWFYKPVAAAKRAGIIKGNESGGFGVGQNITRQDMAVMLMRAADFKDYKWNTSNSAEFTDNSDISEYAKEAVSKLFAEGFVNGMGDGSFKPHKFLTRAEAAKVMYEFLLAVGLIK